MARPEIHAESSARRFGGVASDYLDLHLFLDSTKAAFADNRHRCLTHNSWFVREVIPRVFGLTRTNSDGRQYSTVEAAEQHVAEDFGGYVPAAADYLSCLQMQDWMNGPPAQAPSQALVNAWRRQRSEERTLRPRNLID